MKGHRPSGIVAGSPPSSGTHASPPPSTSTTAERPSSVNTGPSGLVTVATAAPSSTRITRAGKTRSPCA